MSVDLILKYKELEKLVNFLTELASKTVGIIDSNVRKQAIGNPITMELLSNYIAYMGSLNLMVVNSSSIWMRRKMLKQASKNAEAGKKILDSLKQATIAFGNASVSLVQPLTFFSKLYIPQSQKGKSNNSVSSLTEVLTLYNKHVDNLQKLYIKSIPSDSIRAELVAGGQDPDAEGVLVFLGGSDNWVGGLQTQSLMANHLTKLELLRGEDELLIKDQLKSLLKCSDLDICLGELRVDGLKLSKVESLAELDKPVILLEWNALESKIRDYLVKHADIYKQYLIEIPESFVLGAAEGTDTLFNELETLDRKILMGMCYKTFEELNHIETIEDLKRAWQVLIEDNKTILEHPNARTALISDIRFHYDTINSTREKIKTIDTSISYPISGKKPLAILQDIIEAEKKFLPRLNELETLYLALATAMSNVKILYTDLISDDNNAICIRWTGLVVTGLLRRNLIETIKQKRFSDQNDMFDQTIDGNESINLYDGGITRVKLIEFINRFI